MYAMVVATSLPDSMFSAEQISRLPMYNPNKR